MYAEDTIAAIATPPGEGGIAIVRISGPDAERIATTVFARSHGKNGELKSHILYHGKIHDPKTENVVDEVLLTMMRKPHSYTGEDVVEIHCHGGAFLVRQVLGLVFSQGARHAERGEFTKRAFLNGRMDLTQAEAVLDLIRARTEKGIELALNQASGELSKWVHDLREELLDILVQVEAAIDFPEEEIELLKRPELIEKIAGLRKKLLDIIATYEWGRLFREGARVCICGRPNVGKSSLLNALLGQKRVIVTPLPGTTRDVIEESINLAGLPVVLWDTAGIRESNDQIERIGVELSREYIDKADAAIVTLDGSEPLRAEDRACLATVESKKKLIVINKDDIDQKLDVAQLNDLVGSTEVLRLSARTGSGLGKLKRSLRELLLGLDLEPPIVLSNLRHKAALHRGSESLNSASVALSDLQPPEFASVELNEARAALEEVLGTVSTDDILERIFSNFCVGK